ncbi:hypothetical protein TrVFT333_004153 [Trichoderma virens FT-333]|nr:hypothetical protein TrVFT333_004153 [Trichoderma virens FT-333]
MVISADSSGPGANSPDSAKPVVLIIGAGVSGLLLAQQLKREGISYRIFERDADLETRGAGWGLTLHWSLTALQSLLPSGLAERICDESSVDRWADRRGELSRFPFFDLDSGELKAQTPGAVKSARIRVTRQRLRKLLAEGIDIELPVRTMGVKILLTAEQIEPIRKLDLFFLQGASPTNDSFMYISVLDVPGNQADSDPNVFSCQLHCSWPYPGTGAPTDVPATNKERYELLRAYAKTWSEPFRSLVLNNVHADTEIKRLDVLDWAPPIGLHSNGQVVLMGDAFHLMAMYRGEGANHAIIDVLDFATHIVPVLAVNRDKFSSNTGSRAHTHQSQGPNFRQALRQALDAYEDAVVSRARPGVLASRRACLDAHAFSRLFGEAATGVSPLLSKREMMLQFDDESLELIK